MTDSLQTQLLYAAWICFVLRIYAGYRVEKSIKILAECPYHEEFRRVPNHMLQMAASISLSEPQRKAAGPYIETRTVLLYDKIAANLFWWGGMLLSLGSVAAWFYLRLR